MHGWLRQLAHTHGVLEEAATAFLLLCWQLTTGRLLWGGWVVQGGGAGPCGVQGGGGGPGVGRAVQPVRRAEEHHVPTAARLAPTEPRLPRTGRYKAGAESAQTERMNGQGGHLARSGMYGSGRAVDRAVITCCCFPD